jgi:class 3 adenylate cyclase
MHPRVLDPDARSFRVARTFAFLDLCGFTDFVDAHGDDDAVDELRTLRATVREIAPLCGVRVDKWLGDGVMLVGVDSEPVVIAVVAIAERIGSYAKLALRAGIASGEVLLMEGDDYVGRTVNLASRLCDLADAGQVLAALDGLPLPDGVAVASSFTLDVRGLRDAVRVGSLVAGPVDEQDEPGQPGEEVAVATEPSRSHHRRLLERLRHPHASSA